MSTSHGDDQTMLPMFSFRPAVIAPFRFRLMAAVGLLLVASFAPMPLKAQSRNSFPGRRIGGGTRGECAARQIIHLVPESSVYAPGSSGLIAWIEAPSADPRPLQVTLNRQGETVFSRSFQAGGPRLVLLSLPSSQPLPLVWESVYRCSDQPAGDEFGFLAVEAPPARSLLVNESPSSDPRLPRLLQGLIASCGKTVPLAAITPSFGLEAAISSQWPTTLPVECP